MGETIGGGAKRFGFVSTRFAGTDGVSLEARKWADVLERNGHGCYWLAGKLDTDPQRSQLVPEAFFDFEENRQINALMFGRRSRGREISGRIHALKEIIKDALYAFRQRFGIDVLVAENCLTIPMHIPLGLALTEMIVETSIPTIAHHHDFYWERDRYTINAAPDYLQTAFPPHGHNIQHVVINTSAREQLARRTGLTSFVIPNVLDFSHPPPSVDEYSSSFRADIGLTPEDVLILQPTRIISRKGIEHAIELVRRLKDPKYKLVVSHEAGDEGTDYQEFVTEYAASLGVDMRIVAHRIAALRREHADQGKHYTLWDVYPHADLVTYPSLFEGFGNAFLEAVYFGKPLLVNRYSIYVRDIEPKGFQAVEMDGYVTRSVVEEVRRLLEDKTIRWRMVERNYALARQYYSYEVLERKLDYLLANIFGLNGD
ncbi:MAG: glycosyltransferase family 4 protein [Sedimentisphaerales bacterium]|nr:glycosyltransferase family 4 protein [Sedimentisphaerales bacterium]